MQEFIDKIPREKFIEQIVIPFLYGSINKAVYIAVYDISGTVVFASNRYKEIVTPSPQTQIVGTPLKNLWEGVGLNKTIMVQLENIRQWVIHNQKKSEYVLFLNKPADIPVIITHLPIFYVDGSVIATYIIASQFQFVPSYDLLTNNQQNSTPLPTTPNKIYNHQIPPITERQQEVLFMLIAGIPQEQIATYLNISRGTVSSCIAGLCKKFDIVGQSSTLLAAKAAGLGFGSKVPKAFINAGIILLCGPKL